MRSKKELRLEMKAKLETLSSEVLNEYSSKLSSNLKKFLNDLGVIQKHLVIGVFAPIEKEPLWFLEMDELDTAYPAVHENQMVFRRAQKSELKNLNDFGVKILGPDETAALVVPDVILVPGLAFSKKGSRLGRGKGYYDKYLEKSQAIKVGACFEIQIEEDVPTNEHDIEMDFVVTDKSVYKKKS